MKELLSNPFVFSLAAALLAAALTFGYMKTVQPDNDKVVKATFRVFTVVAVSNLVLMLLMREGKEAISTEPFLTE